MRSCSSITPATAMPTGVAAYISAMLAAEVLCAPWYTNAPQIHMPKAPSTSSCGHSKRHDGQRAMSSRATQGDINSNASSQRHSASRCGAMTPSAARAMR